MSTEYIIQKRTGQGSPEDPFVRTNFARILDDASMFDGTAWDALDGMNAAAPKGVRFEFVGIES